MNENKKLLLDSLAGWVAALGVALRAAFLSPIIDESIAADAERQIDPDFEGWLHNDPMVTGNPASRYGEHATGYLTGNGRRSLEIGAADD
jgi:hypothetical protein